jgi:hypothetical protein
LRDNIPNNMTGGHAETLMNIAATFALKPRDGAPPPPVSPRSKTH